MSHTKGDTAPAWKTGFVKDIFKDLCLGRVQFKVLGESVGNYSTEWKCEELEEKDKEESRDGYGGGRRETPRTLSGERVPDLRKTSSLLGDCRGLGLGLKAQW